jgi:hypothetical protein
MSDIELTTSARQGRAIHGSRGSSLHVLDFGGGHKVFAFVIRTRADHG